MRHAKQLKKQATLDSLKNEPKNWDEAMFELNRLMQVIHANNMEVHSVMKKSKESIELSDIKSVSFLFNFFTKILNRSSKILHISVNFKATETADPILK